MYLHLSTILQQSWFEVFEGLVQGLDNLLIIVPQEMCPDEKDIEHESKVGIAAYFMMPKTLVTLPLFLMRPACEGEATVGGEGESRGRSSGTAGRASSTTG